MDNLQTNTIALHPTIRELSCLVFFFTLSQGESFTISPISNNTSLPQNTQLPLLNDTQPLHIPPTFPSTYHFPMEI
ncbi:MAG: hypothetical protein ACK53Y_18550, partial [bacterium]